MADLPVRPGRLRQRRPLMPVLPAGLAAAPLAQRPRRRLGQSLARRRLRRSSAGSASAGPQAQQSAREPAPAPPGLPRRGHRPGQLPAQRCHQPGQHLIRRRLFFTGHIRTLRAANLHRTHLPSSAVSPAPESQAQFWTKPGSHRGIITDVSDDLRLAVTFGPDQPQRFLTAWLGPPQRDMPGSATSDLPAALAQWHRQASRWEPPVMQQNRVPASREMGHAAR